MTVQAHREAISPQGGPLEKTQITELDVDHVEEEDYPYIMKLEETATTIEYDPTKHTM